MSSVNDFGIVCIVRDRTPAGAIIIAAPHDHPPSKRGDLARLSRVFGGCINSTMRERSRSPSLPRQHEVDRHGTSMEDVSGLRRSPPASTLFSGGRSDAGEGRRHGRLWRGSFPTSPSRIPGPVRVLASRRPGRTSRVCIAYRHMPECRSIGGTFFRMTSTSSYIEKDNAQADPTAISGKADTAG
jgi:hypothetical protein